MKDVAEDRDRLWLWEQDRTCSESCLIVGCDISDVEPLGSVIHASFYFFDRYLMENSDWLEEQLGDVDDDYILFDCPGQIELYTHMTVIRQLVDLLQQRWNFRVCGVFLVDSQFMVDGAKFLSGTMAALSVMVNLELPHINILTKMDLLSKSARNQLDRLVTL